MERVINRTSSVVLIAVVCAVASAAASCDTAAPSGVALSTPRNLYEVHAQMDDAQAAGLWAACPADDGARLTVRALSAPQPSGVDVRVEFSGFMTPARAACIDAYLEANGAKEFETDTMYWPPDSGSGSGSDTTTTSGP